VYHSIERRSGREYGRKGEKTINVGLSVSLDRTQEWKGIREEGGEDDIYL
jgi:hypothetical protein